MTILTLASCEGGSSTHAHTHRQGWRKHSYVWNLHKSDTGVFVLNWFVCICTVYGIWHMRLRPLLYWCEMSHPVLLCRLVVCFLKDYFIREMKEISVSPYIFKQIPPFITLADSEAMSVVFCHFKMHIIWIFFLFIQTILKCCNRHHFNLYQIWFKNLFHTL